MRCTLYRDKLTRARPSTHSSHQRTQPPACPFSIHTTLVSIADHGHPTHKTRRDISKRHREFTHVHAACCHRPRQAHPGTTPHTQSLHPQTPHRTRSRWTTTTVLHAASTHRHQAATPSLQWAPGMEIGSHPLFRQPRRQVSNAIRRRAGSGRHARPFCELLPKKSFPLGASRGHRLGLELGFGLEASLAPRRDAGTA